MTNERNQDSRWVVERIDRYYAEHGADIAELKAAVAGLPAAMDRYVLQREYDADERRREIERAADDRRLNALEEHRSARAANSKAWILGIGLAALGALFGWLAQILQARGGH